MKLGRAPQTDGQGQPQAANAFQTAENIQKLLESENKAGEIVAKVLKLGKNIFQIVAAFVLVFGVVSLSNWVSETKSPNPDKVLEALFKADALRDRLHIMIVCSVILLALSSLCDVVAECFLPYQYALWLTRKHISAKDILKNQAELDVEVINQKAKSLIGQRKMKKGLYWAENSRGKAKELVSRVISLLLMVMFCIFTAITLQENLDAYLSSVLLAGEFELKYVNLIVAAVFLVVWSIFYVASESVMDKKIEKWSNSFAEKQA